MLQKYLTLLWSGLFSHFSGSKIQGKLTTGSHNNMVALVIHKVSLLLITANWGIWKENGKTCLTVPWYVLFLSPFLLHLFFVLLNSGNSLLEYLELTLYSVFQYETSIFLILDYLWFCNIAFGSSSKFSETFSQIYMHRITINLLDFFK